MDKLILVVYGNVGSLSPNEIQEYIAQVNRYVASPTNEYITMVVPVRDQETRIECINPKFITNEEMIKRFASDIKDVNKNFERILNIFPYKRETLVEKIKKYINYNEH